MLRGHLLVCGALIGFACSGVTPRLHAETPAGRGAAPPKAQAAAGPQITVEVIEKGNSSRATRKEAIQSLPTKSLHPESQRVVESILDNVSLYRRLPVVRCESDPRVIQFFTEHPDVAVAIWRVMEISEFTMKQTGPYDYQSDSGDGSIGTVQVLYRTPEQQLILCRGQFKSPALPKPIEAQAIMSLTTEFSRDEQGKPLATCRADVFVSFPSATIETAARFIAPVSHRIADRNFEEVVTFIRMMHIAMTDQPVWVEQVASRVDGVLSDRPGKLVDLTAKLYREQHPLPMLPQHMGALPETPEDRRLPRNLQSANGSAGTPGFSPGVPGPPRSSSVMR
ncbi:MAG: hypothetical protein R3C01_00475 [Planctomycetaceae bacterium]